MSIFKNIIFLLLIGNSFLMAELLKPYDDQYISYVHVLFEWEQEPDAQAYNIQLSLNPNFNNNLLDLNTSKLIYIYKNDINWNTEYFWRVRPIYDDDSYGNWINTYDFRIRNNDAGSNGVSVDIINEDLHYQGLTLVSDLSDNNRSFISV